MSAKSKSPEAAQRRVWKQELATLQRSRKGLAKLFRDQANHKVAALTKARRELKQVEKETDRELKRLKKGEARQAKNIESRVAVLRGRLGI